MDPYYKMVSAGPLPSSYVCDTLPAPRLASGSSGPELEPDRSPSPPSMFEVTEEMDTEKEQETLPDTSEGQSTPAPSQPPARKLCVRHQRMADEGTNLKLQQASYPLKKLFVSCCNMLGSRPPLSAQSCA
jgi:F-box and WD-40 domain protein MET30